MKNIKKLSLLLLLASSQMQYASDAAMLAFEHASDLIAAFSDLIKKDENYLLGQLDTIQKQLDALALEKDNLDLYMHQNEFQDDESYTNSLNQLNAHIKKLENDKKNHPGLAIKGRVDADQQKIKDLQEQQAARENEIDAMRKQIDTAEQAISSGTMTESDIENQIAATWAKISAAQQITAMKALLDTPNAIQAQLKIMTENQPILAVQPNNYQVGQVVNNAQKELQRLSAINVPSELARMIQQYLNQFGIVKSVVVKSKLKKTIQDKTNQNNSIPNPTDFIDIIQKAIKLNKDLTINFASYSEDTPVLLSTIAPLITAK